METKNGGVAAVLSLFWPGVGQMYAGRIGRGFVVLAIAIGLYVLAWFGALAVACGTTMTAASAVAGVDSRASTTLGAGGFAVIIMAVAFQIWAIVDAKKLCDSHNAKLRAQTAHVATPVASSTWLCETCRTTNAIASGHCANQHCRQVRPPGLPGAPEWRGVAPCTKPGCRLCGKIAVAPMRVSLNADA